MVKAAPLLEPAAAVVLAPVLEHPHLKLLVVMILTPGIMNAVQFWLVDNIFVHAREEQGTEFQMLREADVEGGTAASTCQVELTRESLSQPALAKIPVCVQDASGSRMQCENLGY